MSSTPTRHGPAPSDARTAVQERDERFRAMLDVLPMAVYATDSSGWVTYFNPAAAELFGRTPELQSDRWCASCKLHWPDGTPLSQIESPMAVALLEGRAVRGAELIVERPDGTRVTCMSHPMLLRGPDGAITGAVNLLVDI